MTKTQQLVFDLPQYSAAGHEDFFAAPSNAAALTRIQQWEAWDGHKLVLCGPQGSGKTHLASVWAEMAGASVLSLSQALKRDWTAQDAPVAIDDCDAVRGDAAAQTELFHIFNITRDAGTPVLLTGVNAPARWGVGLPDLSSRLQSVDVAKLSLPDETLMSAVLIKQFVDRQLNVRPDVVTFLVRRIDRSFLRVADCVAALDAAALEAGKPITVPFAKRVLGL